MIRVVSVPHTGTHFLRKVLIDNGIPCELEHFHCFSGFDGIIATPLRDPWLTYVTFISRNRNLEEFYDSWRILDEMVKEREIFLVPIDVNYKRVTGLRRLGEKLGVDLKTDWKPVSSGQRIEVDPIDLSDIYNLDVVKQFYTQEYQEYEKADNNIPIHNWERIKLRIEKGIDPNLLKEVYNLTDKQFSSILKMID